MYTHTYKIHTNCPLVQIWMSVVLGTYMLSPGLALFPYLAWSNSTYIHTRVYFRMGLGEGGEGICPPDEELFWGGGGGGGGGHLPPILGSVLPPPTINFIPQLYDNYYFHLDPPKFR